MYRWWSRAAIRHIFLVTVLTSALPGALLHFFVPRLDLSRLTAFLGSLGLGLAFGVPFCYLAGKSLGEGQERLRCLEGLNAVGQVSLGLAHELRNPLTAVKGFLQLLGRRLDGDARASHYLSLAIGEVERATRILEDFLQFRRPTALALWPVDVGQIMDEVVTLLAGEAFQREARIYQCYSGSLPSVLADPGRLKQVFLNLLLNALAALAPGGCIWVGYEVRGQGVVIHIKDNGCGMDRQTLARLGEPFFTTKENGTGLGVALSYAIIREHGGWVEVTSAPGAGTHFSINLPVASKEMDRRPAGLRGGERSCA